MSLQHSSDDKIQVIRTQPHQSLGAIIDAQGREVPITEDMIQSACRELEQRLVKPAEHATYRSISSNPARLGRVFYGRDCARAPAPPRLPRSDATPATGLRSARGARQSRGARVVLAQQVKRRALLGSADHQAAPKIRIVAARVVDPTAEHRQRPGWIAAGAQVDLRQPGSGQQLIQRHARRLTEELAQRLINLGRASIEAVASDMGVAITHNSARAISTLGSPSQTSSTALQVFALQQHRVAPGYPPPPRLALINQAPGLSCSRRWRSNRCRVDGSRGCAG